jgi:hypothetical protein
MESIRDIETTGGLRRSFARLLAREEGITLLLALIVTMIMTIAATTAMTVVLGSENTASNERQSARAFNAGEGGLDLGANAVIASSWNGGSTLPPDGTTLSGSSTLDSNTLSWSAKYTAGQSGAAGSWAITSTTTSPNGKVKRALSESLQPSTNTIPGHADPVYGYGLVTGAAPSGGPFTPNVCSLGTTTTFSGTPILVSVPISINGDACISGQPNPAIGNASSAAPIIVYIGGALDVGSDDSHAIGTPSSYVSSAEMIGGCFSSSGGSGAIPCGSTGSGVYADHVDGTGITPQMPPTLDLTKETSLYNSAAPGPMHPCGSGSTGSPPVHLFDSDAGASGNPNTSLGTQDFVTQLGSSAWDCKSGSGELAWTPGGAGGLSGTLSVTGTIFIDGSISMSGSDHILWAGRGSMYVNGTVSMSGQGSFCAVWIASSSSCDFTGWNPDTDPLVFLSAYNGGSHTTTGFDMEGQSTFEGIAFTNGGFYLAGGAESGGSVLADYATLAGNAAFRVTTNTPDSVLGFTPTTSLTTWSVAPRSWHECPSAVRC